MRKSLIVLSLLLLLSISNSFADDTNIIIVDTQTNYSELQLSYIYHDYIFDKGSVLTGIKLYDASRNIYITFPLDEGFDKVRMYWNAKYYYDYANNDLIVLYVTDNE